MQWQVLLLEVMAYVQSTEASAEELWGYGKFLKMYTEKNYTEKGAEN